MTVVRRTSQNRRKRSVATVLQPKAKALRNLFNLSLELSCIADTDGYFLYLNPAWERVLGYSRKELMEKRFFDFVHPNDQDATRDAVSALESHQEINHFENRYRCMDKTYRWLEWNASSAGKTIYATARDITDRKQALEMLNEQLKFESLLSDIAANFVDLPIDRIDQVIRDAQRRVCEFFGLDMSSLWILSDEAPGFIYLTHIYRPLEGPPLPEQMEAKEYFPWCLQQVAAGKVIAVSTEQAPPEAARDKEVWRHFGIRSILTFPIKVGGELLIGALNFATMREERTWPESFVKQIGVLARVFANSLARMRKDYELRESEDRLKLAADSAEVGFWELNCRTRLFWTTDQAREIFGYAPDDVISMEHFEASVHPDDLDLVRQSIARSLNRGEPLKVEYRIRVDGSGVKWISSRGRSYFDSAGKPLRLMGVSLDITERKRAENELKERLQFENLLSDLSAGFVNLAPDKVDGQINTALRSITDFFNVDRTTIGIFSEDGARLDRAYEYQREGAEAAPGSMARDQFPWYIEQLMHGISVVMSRIEDLPPEAQNERRICLAKNMRSLVSIPLSIRGKTIGSCALVSVRAERAWPEDFIPRLRILGEIIVNVLNRRKMEELLKTRLQEIEELKQRLESENVYLQQEIRSLSEHTEIVGQSRTLKSVLAQVEQVAQTDTTVLIQGETGTGKELIARAIHKTSNLKDRTLITVNCASLPPTLFESELFGREKGAYTGAMTRMVGRFELADGSTLFLDEIGEVPLEVQAKLLRVLEEGRFERLGSAKSQQVNVRIIAATNRDLAQDVKAGRFRQDLYYRLNVFPISVPPLRDRSEDIPILVWSFIKEFEKKLGKRIESIPRKSMEALQHYTWPGNIRELRNVIEHGMIVSTGKTLTVHLPQPASLEGPGTSDLEDIERRHILSILEKTGWRIAGKGGAAEILGLKRTTLQSLMKKLDINRPRP